MNLNVILNLIASNLIGRLYLFCMLFFLSNTYDGQALSNILFYQSIFTFVATIAPIKVETHVINTPQNEILSRSFFIYSIAISLIVSLMFEDMVYLLSVATMFLALHANIGISVLIKAEREDLLRSIRSKSSTLGILILFINQWLMADPYLIISIVIALYFSPSLYAISSYKKKLPNNALSTDLYKHVCKYFPNIIEMLVITTTNYSLIFLYKNRLPDLDYSQIIIASQFYISSAILFASTMSLKYLDTLNKSAQQKPKIRGIFVITISLSIFYFVIAHAAVSLSSTINIPFIDAIANFDELSYVAICYVLVIPFTSIFIYKLRFYTNLMFHIIGSVARLAPVIFLDFEAGFKWYIIITILFYAAYGLATYFIHQEK